ncbi:MAG TPA: hypothetical protein VIE44_10575 [Methylomirabilota bacterium]
MSAVLQTANFLLATAQWLILGRLLLRLFIRNPRNAVWQMFLIATDPPYRVSRFLTGGRVAENWLWLVSLLWLLAARIVLARLAAPVVS